MMIWGYIMGKVFRFSFFMAEKKERREKEARVKENATDKWEGVCVSQ